MCDVCCRECGEWSRSFTRTETFLTILECVLLVIFTLLLGFTILHLLVCFRKDSFHKQEPIEDEHKYDSVANSRKSAVHVECSWRPSHTTETATRYYEQETNTTTTAATEATTAGVTDVTHNDYEPDLSDGENAARAYKELVLALVKMRPPHDITFGCILIKITRYWTLTAASCIEAIEEVDTLDSFVMMEGYGEIRRGKSHSVADVRIHPLYGGTNRSYDLVALRSEDDLGAGVTPVTLPTTLDYYFTVIGEKLALLGYGRYRSVDSRAAGRGLRAASVEVVAASRCGGGGDAWALRHLARPQPAPTSRCGARPLCCGPREERGLPCNYCSGSPLMAGPARLLGLMADNPQCGVACEPAFFVTLAAPAVRGWLDAVVAATE